MDYGVYIRRTNPSQFEIKRKDLSQSNNSTVLVQPSL